MGHQQGNALEGGGATPVCNRPGTVVSGDRAAGFAGDALPRQHETPAQAEAPPMSLGRCLRRGLSLKCFGPPPWCSTADASESSVRHTCHMLSSLSGYGTTLVSPMIRCRGTQNGRWALLISPHCTTAGKTGHSPRPSCRLHPSTLSFRRIFSVRRAASEDRLSLALTAVSQANLERQPGQMVGKLAI